MVQNATENLYERELELDKWRASIEREYDRKKRTTNAVLFLSAILSIALFSFKNQILILLFGFDEIRSSGFASGTNGQILTAVAALFALLAILTASYQYLSEINIFSKELPESIVRSMKMVYGTRLERGTHDTDQFGVTVLHAAKKTPSVETDDEYDRSMQRLSAEIKLLNRRGTINLLIGVATTLTAVAILASTIFYSTTNQVDLLGVTSHFIPRITLSIFIEIFSFFFLRLYSSGLNDMKYYQNELTNIELIFIALRRAIEVNDKACLTKILINMAKTERNFILKKGETTQDLERAIQLAQSERQLLVAVTNLAKAKP